MAALPPSTAAEFAHECWPRKRRCELALGRLPLIIDGETAINCDEAKTRLKSKGIDVRIRAPGQHARNIEPVSYTHLTLPTKRIV